MLNRLYFTLLLLLIFFQETCGSMIQPIGLNSLFATGKWVKIETSTTGIHKIQYSWLKSAGFSHPENVKIAGIPFLRLNEGAGNESLLFFVNGSVSWKFNSVSTAYKPFLNQSAQGKSIFFLTDNIGSELLLPVSEKMNETADLKTSSYEDLLYWGEENLNLLESGSMWFSSLLSGGNALSKNFSIPDRLADEKVNINVYAAGRSSSITGMELSVNGNSLGKVTFSPVQPSLDQDFASYDSIKISRLIAGTDLSFSLKYSGAPSDQSWFDFATIQTRRSLYYRGSPLTFRDSRTIGKGKVVEYQVSGAIPGLQLWEISNPLSPIQTVYQLSNGLLIFRSKSDSLRTFLLFDPSSQLPGLTKVEEVKNSDILKTDVPQFLILTPARFLEQANRLANFHRQKDVITVSVVTVESIYNELSGGYPDIAALKNFVGRLYHQKKDTNGSILKYLLLFGKGTCDPVHSPNEKNPNWIPSFQSVNSLNGVNSYVTDDYFGFLDSEDSEINGSLDLGIGRIPAVSDAEATIAIDKIIHYHEAQTLGDWRNNVTFIGDDEDNNIHVSDSETLATMVNNNNPEYRTSKIYLDAYPQVLTPDERYPEVNVAIRRSVHSGNLFVNYIGHASEDGLAHERVLTINDIDSWTNKDRLPLFVTATCEFSRWDMIQKRSAGEHLLFNAAGGAIALLSATRLVYSASNFEINKSFINHVFDKDGSGSSIRLGDLIRLVKNENSGSVNTLKFCLLGDPALRLNYPEYESKNLEINNQSVSQFSGSVSPLGLVTISGEIQNSKGKRMDQFNGSMSATVFDQPSVKSTLGNSSLSPFSYKVQDNILFNGNILVKNGLFAYSFTVPKDVNFNKEAGLIRYYFSNGTTDGNGSLADIHFNGTETSAVADNRGPVVNLFLENEQFQEGGSVSQNPLLLVLLSDESGINTSGIGIGHDITLELDGFTKDQVVLNDFYKSDPDNYKSGTIQYPMSTLSAGSHSLKLKVWDNANNSSTVFVHFVVNKELLISSLYNFPNPFSDQTRFVISHNRYDELVGVNLEILDLSGRKIYAFNQSLVSKGYDISDLYWSPKQLNPVPANGIYFYRITIKDKEGFHTSKSGRLIWRK